MNQQPNGHVPDLGKLAQQKVFGASLAGLPRVIDDMGLVSRGVLARSQYLDGEQLLAEIRQVVREELRAALKRGLAESLSPHQE